VDIYRELAKRNPAMYLPRVGSALNRLGASYATHKQLQPAEAAFAEARDIFLESSKARPGVYEPHLADALDGLGMIYTMSDPRRVKEAETAYEEELTLRRRLEKNNQDARQSKLAGTLSNLTMLHFLDDQPAKASEEVKEAVSINRERWKTDPDIAADDLAKSLLLASFVQTEPEAKCKLVREAAQVARDSMVKGNADQLLQGCGQQ
jgi:hypothetical protein